MEFTSLMNQTDRKSFDVPEDVVAAAINVYKVYKAGNLEAVALQDISFSIREGEMLAVVGPSGSGKSTLLHALGGMISPTSGSIYWSNCGYDISKLNPNKVVELRRTFIGFVFQKENLIPHLTALQNVELSARIASLPEPKKRAERLLESVGLGKRMGFNPAMLSSGERQRMAIACALVNDPKLVLADEPTGDLDLQTGEKVLDLFKELNQETGVAFFIVTHSQQIASRASRMLEIRDGVFVGSHARGVNLKCLDETRILNLDSLSRLPIPPSLLNQLGNPKSFKASIKNGEIIMCPYHKEGVEMAISALVCVVCGKVINERRITCPDCGSVL
jgi:lipoprotein-releasing system ATP-binding protein